MTNELKKMDDQFENLRPEIIVMRRVESTTTNKSWSPWELFGVVVAAIVIGNIVWWWGAGVYAQHELGLALEKERLEQQSAENKLKIETEQYYRDMNRREFENQQIQARINIENQKQQAILNQQQQWQTLSNNQNIQYNTHAPSSEEAKAETCKSWINSNIIEPSAAKGKYIKENCSLL